MERRVKPIVEAWSVGPEDFLPLGHFALLLDMKQSEMT